MTEEEIRPIAEDYVEEYCHCSDGEYTDGDLVCAGIGTALIVSRQLEKQIQIDAGQIRALQKQNGELTDENERLKGDLELWESGACRATNLDKCGVVKELKAQIEKMKRCAICKHSTDLGYCKIRCSGGECDNHSSWEIKEK